jgi:acetyl-CoA acetyltransferase
VPPLGHLIIIAPGTNHPPVERRRDRARMLHPILWTLVKVVIASLLLGAILAHFGITVDQLMHKFGLSAERLEDYAKRGFAWAWPNVLLGSLVIVPIWFLIVLFRPPRQSRRD